MAWNPHSEGRSRPDVNLDLAALGRGGLLYQCQSESASLGLWRLLGRPPTPEHLIGSIGRQAGTRVGNGQDHLVIVGGDIDEDRPFVEIRCSREDVDGVVDEVAENGDSIPRRQDSLTGDLPASYLQVLTLPLQLQLFAHPSFPLPAVGLVHVASRMTQHRRVSVAEHLTLTAWAADLHAHPKGVTLQLHAEAHAAGQLVWQGVSRYLARGVRWAGAQHPGHPDEPVGSGEARGDEPALADVRVGAEPVGSWQLPADLGRRYAAVSGDVNPIHLSAASARPFGFRRPIAHGLWTHARSLAVLGGVLPESFTTVVEFRSPVLLPGRVAVHYGRSGDTRVIEVRPGRGERLHLRTVCIRSH